MLAWFQVPAEPGLVNDVLKVILNGGLAGAALVACAMLWRSNQAKDKTIESQAVNYQKSLESLLREMLGHADKLNDIPEALDRLREATLGSRR